MKKFLFTLKLIWWAYKDENKLNAYLRLRDAQNTYFRLLKQHKNSKKAFREYTIRRAQYESEVLK